MHIIYFLVDKFANPLPRTFGKYQRILCAFLTFCKIGRTTSLSFCCCLSVRQTQGERRCNEKSAWRILKQNSNNNFWANFAASGRRHEHGDSCLTPRLSIRLFVRPSCLPAWLTLCLSAPLSVWLSGASAPSVVIK